jgi:metal-responsive CopG/Arc/MetJ family transcriptional regulator
MRITIYLPDELAKKIDSERRKREKIPTISSIIQEALVFYFSKRDKFK